MSLLRARMNMGKMSLQHSEKNVTNKSLTFYKIFKNEVFCSFKKNGYYKNPYVSRFCVLKRPKIEKSVSTFHIQSDLIGVIKKLNIIIASKRVNNNQNHLNRYQLNKRSQLSDNEIKHMRKLKSCFETLLTHSHFWPLEIGKTSIVYTYLSIMRSIIGLDSLNHSNKLMEKRYLEKLGELLHILSCLDETKQTCEVISKKSHLSRLDEHKNFSNAVMKFLSKRQSKINTLSSFLKKVRALSYSLNLDRLIKIKTCLEELLKQSCMKKNNIQLWTVTSDYTIGITSLINKIYKILKLNKAIIATEKLKNDVCELENTVYHYLDSDGCDLYLAEKMAKKILRDARK